MQPTSSATQMPDSFFPALSRKIALIRQGNRPTGKKRGNRVSRKILGYPANTQARTIVRQEIRRRALVNCGLDPKDEEAHELFTASKKSFAGRTRLVIDNKGTRPHLRRHEQDAKQ